MTEHAQIKFYATTWCHDCAQSKSFLDSQNIPYTYINIDDVPEGAEEVVKINNGLRSVPTIVFPNGTVLVEPAEEELAKAVDELHNKVKP